MKPWILGALLLVVLAFAGCGAPSEADVQAAIAATATAQATEACGPTALASYATAVEEQFTTFQAQTAVTASTPRASLGTPLQKLVDLQTETRRMAHPPCLEAYHARVVSMMGLYRLAYETFAAQGDETMVQASLQLGAQTLADLKVGLPTIRVGQVPPEPTPLPGVPTTAP